MPFAPTVIGDTRHPAGGHPGGLVVRMGHRQIGGTQDKKDLVDRRHFGRGRGIVCFQVPEFQPLGYQ